MSMRAVALGCNSIFAACSMHSHQIIDMEENRWDGQNSEVAMFKVTQVAHTAFRCPSRFYRLKRLQRSGHPVTSNDRSSSGKMPSPS